MSSPSLRTDARGTDKAVEAALEAAAATLAFSPEGCPERVAGRAAGRYRASVVRITAKAALSILRASAGWRSSPGRAGPCAAAGGLVRTGEPAARKSCVVWTGRTLPAVEAALRARQADLASAGGKPDWANSMGVAPEGARSASGYGARAAGAPVGAGGAGCRRGVRCRNGAGRRAGGAGGTGRGGTRRRAGHAGTGRGAQTAWPAARGTHKGGRRAQAKGGSGRRGAGPRWKRRAATYRMRSWRSAPGQGPRRWRRAGVRA